MKMYKKSDLAIIDGLIVSTSSSEVVVIDPTIIKQANDLETKLQQAEWFASQPVAVAGPNPDDFKRKSIKDKTSGMHFEASTPLLDMEARRSMRIMDELDDMAAVESANQLLDCFNELIQFADADFVFESPNWQPEMVMLDTPTIDERIGGVLSLTRKDIIGIVAKVAGLESSDDCSDCDDYECVLNPNSSVNDTDTEDTEDTEE